MAQTLLNLGNTSDVIQTLVISRQRDFDSLFDGFTGLRAVSYVSSADMLLDFLDKRGYESIELLVGENLDAKQLKDDLAKKEMAVTIRLAEELEAGRLRILTPPRTIHSKFYILQNADHFRVINTSANLSNAARRAGSQMNYAWYMDVCEEHPMLLQAERDYLAHCEGSALFMGDLAELLRKRQDLTFAEVRSVWLGTESNTSRDSAEMRAVVQGLASEVFAHPGEEEQPVIRIALPTTPGARKETQKLLKPLGIDDKSPETSVSPARLVRFIEETHGVPLMRVNGSREELWLGFRGNIERLDAALPSSFEVDQALEGLEAYINTVDLGQCPDMTFAKTSMYEALLYVLAAPFSNELMKERRRRLGIVNKRGPRFLYIYGPTQNGKSTFMRYCLNLITGNLVEPLAAGWFTKPRVQGAEAIGTCFPLMFDDMLSITSKTFEDLTKSHWETTWTEEDIFPQFIFTSNNLTLKDWAKSRMKRVDFDVHFVPTTQTQEHLAKILEKPNPLFRWFARCYLERLHGTDWLQDDELATAREVMRTLYEHSRRGLPSYFPSSPLENLYDPDLRVWRELLRHKKARLQKSGDQTIVIFSDDLEHAEIREYQAAMPQTIKYHKRGKTLIVENPEYLDAWMVGKEKKGTLWSRFFPRRTDVHGAAETYT